MEKPPHGNGQSKITCIGTMKGMCYGIEPSGNWDLWSGYGGGGKTKDKKI